MTTRRGRFEGCDPDPAERDDLAAGVGQRLRDARVTAALTRDELARRAGCAPSTVKRIELGTRRPRTSLLDSLADALTAAPADARDLADDLRHLAGRSLRPDNSASTRRRARRVRKARRASQARTDALRISQRLEAIRARTPAPPPREPSPREPARRAPSRLPTVRELIAAGHPEWVDELRGQRIAAGLDADG